MSVLWNPRVGWLAGKKGAVWPVVCFASWMESTPNGKLSRTSEVGIYEQLLFQKQVTAEFARPSVPAREGCWDQRAGDGAETSALALFGPLWQKPLLGRTECGNKPFPPQVYRPGSGREPHSSGGWEMFSLVCGWADVGVLPSCPQQDGTRESKQNRSLSQWEGPRNRGLKQGRSFWGRVGVRRACGEAG